MFAAFGSERSKDTITLKTLRSPGVKTLRTVFDGLSIDDKYLKLADEAHLDPLLNLLVHQHPTVRSFVEVAITNLDRVGDDEIIMKTKGLEALYELLVTKDLVCQRESIWAVAILACLSESNHPDILVYIGWATILSIASRSQVSFLPLSPLLSPGP